MIFEGEISWVTSSLLSQEHKAKHKATATFIERESQTKPGMETTINSIIINNEWSVQILA
jgi:hypothetical protein